MTEQTPKDVQGYSVALTLPEEDMKNCIPTTAPISPDILRAWFANKELWVITNYSQSKLKGAQYLTYMTNLGIPGDIFFETPIPFDEYEEILVAFLKQNSVCNIAGLNVMAAQMLLWAKGLDYDKIPYDLPITVDYIGNFIGRNQELVDKWIHFLDSAQVFALRSIKALNDHFKPEENYEVIEDRTYVGTNVATLFSMPEFSGLYYAMKPKKLSYFKQQFEEYMFKGMHLSHYFMHRNCVPALLFSHFASGVVTAEELDHPLFQHGVFHPDMNFPKYDHTKRNQKPEEAVQDGQPVVGETGASAAVPSQPESGAA